MSDKPDSDIAARHGHTEAERRAAPVDHINVDTYRQSPAPAAATAFGGNGVSDIAGIQKALDARLEEVRHPAGQYDSAKR
jgi:hypothetical protein